MDRGPQAAAVNGHHPADRNSGTSDPRDRATWASPSYVESILFGRRWTRGANPGPSPETPATPEEERAQVSNQVSNKHSNKQEPRMNKKGIEPCAS